jgi:hypothetical protein
MDISYVWTIYFYCMAFQRLTKDSIYYCRAVRPNRKGMIPGKTTLLPD